MNSTRIKKEIIAIGNCMYTRNFIAGTEGNISARISKNRLLITPAGVHKGHLKPQDLVWIDLHGERKFLKKKPSTEYQMHLFIYKQRDDVNGVVHGHPPYATALAVAGETIPDNFVPEAVLSLGPIPLTNYATPGTEEVPSVLKPYIANHNVFLLRSHGLCAIGQSLNQAAERFEMTEHLAQIYWLAKAIGKVKPLNPLQLQRLQL